MTALIGVGAGGHARVVLEILLEQGYEPVALLDPRRELWDADVLGVPVTGDDSLLPRYRGKGIAHVFVGLGGADDTRPRRRLTEHVLELGFEVVPAVHRTATISPHAELGVGATVLAGAIVNAAARIGDHVILNTGALVEHECLLGDFVHVATGARLASGVCVGDGVHVGAGATVRQGVTIGAGSVIGIGSAVVHDVSEGVVVAGVPARVLRPVSA